MKRIVLIILVGGALHGVAQGVEAVYKTPLEKDNGTVTVRPFNLDEIEEIEQLGYERGNGGAITTGVNEGSLWTQEYCIYNRDNFPARPVKLISCVFVINTLIRRDSKGHPEWKNEDAILIDFNGNDLRTFDSGDTYCSSSLYPKKSVIAIGLWKWRKKPQVGGYAYSLRKALLVDPESKKFKEIPIDSVKCEVNEDRD